MKHHFRSHQLSVWLRLVPELHRAGREDAHSRHPHDRFQESQESELYLGPVRPFPRRENATVAEVRDTNCSSPFSGNLIGADWGPIGMWFLEDKVSEIWPEGSRRLFSLQSQGQTGPCTQRTRLLCESLDVQSRYTHNQLTQSSFFPHR